MSCRLEWWSPASVAYSGPALSQSQVNIACLLGRGMTTGYICWNLDKPSRQTGDVAPMCGSLYQHGSTSTHLKWGLIPILACWRNAGPTSQTVAQHYTSIVSMIRVCWVESAGCESGGFISISRHLPSPRTGGRRTRQLWAVSIVTEQK